MSAYGPWVFIDVDEVISLHAEMLSRYGGQASPPKAGCVESSVGTAISSAMYSTDQAEPDLLCAVAYLLMYLAKNHCFVDGNKRVAWSAAVRVLDVNGVRLREDDAEAAQLVTRVATGEARVGEVVAWLAQPARLRDASLPG